MINTEIHKLQKHVFYYTPRYGFNDRTLPHFTKDDFGAESRGFVETHIHIYIYIEREREIDR